MFRVLLFLGYSSCVIYATRIPQYSSRGYKKTQRIKKATALKIIMSTELRRSIRNGFTTQSPASPFKSSSSSSSISTLSASPKSNRNKSAEEKQEFQTTCNRINQAVKTLGDLAVTSNCFEEYRKSSLRYKVATKSVIDEVYKSLSHFDEIMELQPGSDEYRYFADELRKKLAKLLHLNIYCKYKKTNKYGFLCKVFVNEDVPSEDQDLYKIEHEQVRYLMDQILRKKSRNRELTDKQKKSYLQSKLVTSHCHLN